MYVPFWILKRWRPPFALPPSTFCPRVRSRAVASGKERSEGRGPTAEEPPSVRSVWRGQREGLEHWFLGPFPVSTLQD